jgi:hypothetical protein
MGLPKVTTSISSARRVLRLPSATPRVGKSPSLTAIRTRQILLLVTLDIEGETHLIDVLRYEGILTF